MKRSIALSIISILILVCATGCGADKQPTGVTTEEVTEPPPTSQITESEAPTTTTEIQMTVPSGYTLNRDISVEEQVLSEQDNVRITLTSLNMDSYFGPEFFMYIENDNDYQIAVQPKNAAINGIMVDAMMLAEVDAGSKIYDSFSFMLVDLEECGIETIKDVELKFNIYDAETWELKSVIDTAYFASSADPGYVQEYDESGTALVNQNGVRVISGELDFESSDWGPTLHLYIANDSVDDITVQLIEASMNNYLMNPYFICDVLSGKKAYTSVIFLQDQMDENGITNVDEIKLRFSVVNSGADGAALFETDTVTLRF